MNTRKPRSLTPCKFPGMTREEYDARLNGVLSLNYPRLRVGPALDANGLPVTGGSLATMIQSAAKRLGASAFGGGMYRAVERSKTGARECARRLRQRQVASV